VTRQLNTSNIHVCGDQMVAAGEDQWLVMAVVVEEVAEVVE
jgi:hypothetical protein